MPEAFKAIRPLSQQRR